MSRYGKILLYNIISVNPHGFREVVKLLLEVKVSFEIPDNAQVTPLESR